MSDTINQPELDISYYKQHRDNVERQFLDEVKNSQALQRQVAAQQEQISKLLSEIDELKGGSGQTAKAPTPPKGPKPTAPAVN